MDNESAGAAAPSKLAKAACKSCLGTGWLLSLNSMFIGDGFTRGRCGICGGTGQSRHPDFGFNQRQFRVFEAALRRAPKDADTSERGRIARDAWAANAKPIARGQS